MLDRVSSTRARIRCRIPRTRTEVPRGREGMMADNRQTLGLLGRSEQAMERGIVVLMCCWEAKCGEPEIQGSGWPGGGSGCMREEVDEARPRPGVEERGDGRGSTCMYVCTSTFRMSAYGMDGGGVEETGAVVRAAGKSCWDRKLSFPSLAHFLTPSLCSRTRRGTQVKVESHGLARNLTNLAGEPSSAPADQQWLPTWMAQCGGSRTRLSFTPAGPRRQRRAAEDVGGGRGTGGVANVWMLGGGGSGRVGGGRTSRELRNCSCTYM